MNQRGCYGTPARIPSPTSVGLDIEAPITDRGWVGRLALVGVLGALGALVGKNAPESSDNVVYTGMWAGFATGVVINQIWDLANEVKIIGSAQAQSTALPPPMH